MSVDVEYEFCFVASFSCFKGDKNTGHAECGMCAPVGTTAEELLLTYVVEIEVAGFGSLTCEQILVALGGMAAACIAELFQCVGDACIVSGVVEGVKYCFCIFYTFLLSQGIGILEVIDILLLEATVDGVHIVEIGQTKRVDVGCFVKFLHSSGNCIVGICGHIALQECLFGCHEVVQLLLGAIGGGAYILHLEVVVEKAVPDRSVRLLHSKCQGAVGHDGCNPFVVVESLAETVRS